VQNLVKKGEVNPLTIELINMERMCENYGWTPRDIEEMDVFYLDAFLAALAGRTDGEEKPNK